MKESCSIVWLSGVEAVSLQLDLLDPAPQIPLKRMQEALLKQNLILLFLSSYTSILGDV